MSGNVEDVISKMQSILDNFFSLLGSFAFDKAKEYLVSICYKFINKTNT